MEILQFTDFEMVQRYVKAVPSICDYLENRLKLPGWLSYYLSKALGICYAMWEILLLVVLVFIIAIIIYRSEQKIKPK